jgi:hypothetical protein
MSSTTTFSGECGSKPSSRVLRPPGGGSSISFGSGDSEVQVSHSAKKVEAQKDSTASSNSPLMESGKKTVSADAQALPSASGATGVATGAPRRTCGYNPITGEAYSTEAAPKPAPSTNHTRQPPGGASSGLW